MNLERRHTVKEMERLTGRTSSRPPTPIPQTTLRHPVTDRKSIRKYRVRRLTGTVKLQRPQRDYSRIPSPERPVSQWTNSAWGDARSSLNRKKLEWLTGTPIHESPSPVRSICETRDSLRIKVLVQQQKNELHLPWEEDWKRSFSRPPTPRRRVSFRSGSVGPEMKRSSPGFVRLK
jgi:hypothetical protein